MSRREPGRWEEARAVGPAMPDYMLKSSKRDWGEGTDERARAEVCHGSTN
jgi:hypothetical protein